MVTATIAAMPAAAGAKGASPAKAQPGFQDALRQAMSTREAPKSEKSRLPKDAAGLWLAVAAQPYERVVAETPAHGGPQVAGLTGGRVAAEGAKTSLAAAGGTAPETARPDAKDLHVATQAAAQATAQVQGLKGELAATAAATTAHAGRSAQPASATQVHTPEASAPAPTVAKALAGKAPAPAPAGEGVARTVAGLAGNMLAMATEPGRVALRPALASTPAEAQGSKESEPSSAIGGGAGAPGAATSLRRSQGAATTVAARVGGTSSLVAARVGGTSSLGSHGHGQAGNVARDGENGRQVAVPGTLAAAAPGAAPRSLGTGPVDGASVAAQVAAVAQRTAAGMESGAASVRLQLDPPELGHVQVTLRAAQDGIVAVLRAENPTAIAVLQGGQEDLRQRLGALGFKATSVEVTAADRPRIVVASSRSSAGRRRD
jgi:flagellar hook-length control protein FliK